MFMWFLISKICPLDVIQQQGDDGFTLFFLSSSFNLCLFHQTWIQY